MPRTSARDVYFLVHDSCAQDVGQQPPVLFRAPASSPVSAEVNARLQSKLAGWQTNLGRVLDAIGDGVLIINLAGRVIHQNQSVRQLLGADPERERLLRDVTRLVHTLVPRLRARESAVSGAEQSESRELQTATGCYRVQVTSTRDLIETGETAIVTLRRAGEETMSEVEIRDRFGFTSRQVRVALLLAEGLTIVEIARALAISPHTARHHTEQVLQKAGVRSRAQLAALLRRAG